MPPEQITPGEQEVNNSGTPPDQTTPTDQTTPEQPPIDQEKKDARLKQLADLGFTEDNGVYTKPGDFGEAIKDEDILTVPDDVWDAEIAKLETESNSTPEEETEPEVNHPPFDYTGKVRLSQQEFDAIDSKKAIKAVKASDVSQHDKEVLLQQIKDDKLEYAYAEMLRMIMSADRQGQRYSGHL